ncbi:hypothetical protein, partial [Desulfovibrio piger]|uniref:hypothetical protein n=1 Tax=Desulfovibrio piger TaxID=901 RepID=UPI001E0588D9
MAQPTIAQLESRIHQLEQALHQQLTHHERLCRIVLHLQERLIARNDAALSSLPPLPSPQRTQ